MDRKILPAVLATVVVFFAACSQPARVNLERTNNNNGSSAAPAVMPKAGFVYTADERGNSISVVDLSTGRVRTTQIRISPHNVQVSLDGRLLFVVGMVGGMTGDQPEMEMGRGRLLVFETAKMNAESAIDIEVGREPAHVIIDKENKLAYASNAEGNTVSVVDVAQRKVVGEIKTGASPHGLRMSPDGREIFVVVGAPCRWCDTGRGKGVCVRLQEGEGDEIPSAIDGSERSDAAVDGIPHLLHRQIASANYPGSGSALNRSVVGDV